MAVDLQAMRKLLDEKEWELLGFSVDSLTGDQEIKRGIPSDKIPRAQWNAAKQFIATYASSLNNKPCSTVTGPSADREPYDGVWRHVSEGFDVARNAKQYLSQTLRLGYVTSLLNSDNSINYSEARLVEGIDQQPLGAPNYKRLTIRWLNCAPESACNIALSLNTTPITDPVIKGIKQTGVWYNSGAIPSIMQDGSASITLQLSQQYRELPYFPTEITSDVLTDTRQQLGLTIETPETMAPDPAVSAVYDPAVTYTVGKRVHSANKEWVSLINGNIGNDPATVATAWKECAGVNVKVQQISINQDSSKNIHTTKKIATPVHVPEFVARIGERETIYQSEEKHDPNVPDILKYKPTGWTIGPDTTVALDANGNPVINIGSPAVAHNMDVVILSHDLDDFLTNNYKKRRSVRKFPITDAQNVAGITWDVYDSKETISIQSVQANSTPSGQTYIEYKYVYQTIYHYATRYFNDPFTAVAWMNYNGFPPTVILPDDPNADGGSGGLKTKVLDSANGSFHHTAENEWEATRVNSEEHSLRYTYHYADPSL